MIAAGRAGAVADLKLKDWSQCAAGQFCFKVENPSLAMVGTDAGVFQGRTGQYPQGGMGSFCLVFLSHSTSGWHYVNVSCAQNDGWMPGVFDHVTVSSGCANVRTAPSLTANVLACLRADTQVSVDSAPVYADGHIWWHLQGRGWMAHDYLARATFG
jgi:hypothetical protein